MATRACATGMRRREARRSNGSSSATRNPKPIVTAEVPSGSISTASNTRALLPRDPTMTKAASIPIPVAIRTAGMAKRNVLAIASTGETNSADARGGSNRFA